MSKRTSALFTGLGLTLAASSSFAAVDAAVGTALTGLQTDGLAIAALVMPVVIALMAAGIGIKLVKRFGNKV